MSALTGRRTPGSRFEPHAGGVLKPLQRGVTLQALSESSSSFGTDAVVLQTASTREWRRVVRSVSIVSMGIDRKAYTLGRRRTRDG